MIRSRRKAPGSHRGWWFAAATVVALAVAPLIAPTLGMSMWLASGTVLLAAFLLYVILNAPPRYRWFGWGQSRQAVDHRAGRFDGTYPEDRSGLELDSTGRTEPTMSVRQWAQVQALLRGVRGERWLMSVRAPRCPSNSPRGEFTRGRCADGVATVVGVSSREVAWATVKLRTQNSELRTQNQNQKKTLPRMTLMTTDRRRSVPSAKSTAKPRRAEPNPEPTFVGLNFSGVLYDSEVS